MVEFKVVCSDPETGESWQVDVSGHHANSLVSKSIGDEVEGMFLDLPGYKLQITGGTDEDGVPMRPEIPSIGRKRIMVSKSKGFKPTMPGERKKRSFRGNTVSPEVTQINMKIVERGAKPVDELLQGDGAEEPDEGAAEDDEGEADEAADSEDTEDEG